MRRASRAGCMMLRRTIRRRARCRPIRGFSACRRVLSPGGTLVAAGVGGADGRGFWRRLGRMLTGALIARFTSRRMGFYVTRLKQADLVTLAGLLESRKVTPVFDSRHRLSETSEGFRRLAQGHARGKIVVTVDQNGALAKV